MVPERLRPLLARLKNPPADNDESFEADEKREVVSTAICLIEQGISPQLTKKFNSLKNEKLEEFVLGAAMVIGLTMTKDERQVDKEVFLKNKINNIMMELAHYNKSSLKVLAGPISFKGQIKTKNRKIDCYKETVQVREALHKWMNKHLKQNKPLVRPDVVDRLIRLFEEYLPDEAVPFIEKQIINMLLAFGIEYKKRSFEACKRRDSSK